jgi:3-oxoacid CoA-transferase subunit B
VKGMGGAMDLVAGTDNIIVAMQHTNRAGESKLLKRCSLPLTGKNCIRRVITDLGFFTIQDDAFTLLELAPGVSVEEVQAKTEGKLIVSPNVKTMQLD